MKTTERFERAITKLYKAFHEGTLNAMSCEACAVGNIVGHGEWMGYNPSIGYLEMGEFDKDFNNKHMYPESDDYSKKELQNIEFLFLKSHCGVAFFRRKDVEKELQFKGLCAVVEYLCELDGIPNVMDYSSLFEYDDLGAVNQLETVFP